MTGDPTGPDGGPDRGPTAGPTAVPTAGPTAEVVDPPGLVLLRCPADGGRLRSHADAVEVVGEALGHGADLVVIPAGRLHEDFFDLASGVAGDVLQTFVNYQLRLVVLGDISGHLAASSALRALVAESDRGRQAWFVSDENELSARLGRVPAAAGTGRGRAGSPGAQPTAARTSSGTSTLE